MGHKALIAESQAHKFVVDITTDGDLEILDQDSGEFSTSVIMEWKGNDRESVIAQAKQYLTNIENYRSEAEELELFIENNVNVAIATIEGGKAFWSLKQVHEVTFSYVSPIS